MVFLSLYTPSSPQASRGEGLHTQETSCNQANQQVGACLQTRVLQCEAERGSAHPHSSPPKENLSVPFFTLSESEVGLPLIPVFSNWDRSSPHCDVSEATDVIKEGGWMRSDAPPRRSPTRELHQPEEAVPGQARKPEVSRRGL